MRHCDPGPAATVLRHFLILSGSIDRQCERFGILQTGTRHSHNGYERGLRIASTHFRPVYGVSYAPHMARIL